MMISCYSPTIPATVDGGRVVGWWMVPRLLPIVHIVPGITIGAKKEEKGYEPNFSRASCFFRIPHHPAARQPALAPCFIARGSRLNRRRKSGAGDLGVWYDLDFSVDFEMHIHEKLPETLTSASDTADVISVPRQHHYALVCHKNEADRIRDALLQLSNEWIDLSSKSNSGGISGYKSGAENLSLIDKQCITVPIQEEKGRRKDRQGYNLMVIIGAVMSPAQLMHMARKQISWTGRLSHRTHTRLSGVENETGSNQPILTSVVKEVWAQLVTLHRFDVNIHSLRLDVHPKRFNAEVCEAIQHVARMNKTVVSSENDPIQLTYSATKARCVVSIIICASSELSKHQIYWGVSTSEQHWNELNEKMNDNATREILLKTTDSITGLNVSSQHVPAETPVSRAYYKLAQIFEDRNTLEMISSMHGLKNASVSPIDKLLSHGSGIDIGASPGGWTQVMHSKLNIPTIAAVDPGILAQRVSSLQGVQHIRNDIASDETIKCLATHAPFSLVVCDACVDVAVLFEKILQSLEGISSLLQNPSEVFAWPLCFVVTLKFPYKTSSSIERHMDRANATISEFLEKIKSVGFGNGYQLAEDVEVKYKIYHLFANSVAERCLIAVFNKN